MSYAKQAYRVEIRTVRIHAPGLQAEVYYLLPAPYSPMARRINYLEFIPEGAIFTLLPPDIFCHTRFFLSSF